MFACQLRRAIEVSPRVDLHKVAGALWKALAAGSVTEGEAAELDELIAAKQAVPDSEKPAQRRTGSRPRSTASMERRRSWAASGAMPPQIAARFTLAEQAVLAVVAAEVRRHGACTLTLGHIAALAGVSVSTVKNAIREAHTLGFVRIEERRLTAWRNLANKVTITAPEWTAWLRLRRRGVGLNPYSPRIQGKKEGAAYRPQRAAGKEPAAGPSPKRHPGDGSNETMRMRPV